MPQVGLLVFQSSTQTCAELHEKAFRRLGGRTPVVVLDNLREGVLKPDIYGPTINPVPTSNRPVEDWGKLPGDVVAVTAMLDRILHHGHVLKCGPRSWRTKVAVAVEAQ